MPNSLAIVGGGGPATVAKRALYNAAGAFGAGHVLARDKAEVQLLANAWMIRRMATKALFSLPRQVPQNYEELGPYHAWTGPLHAAIMEWWNPARRR